MQSSSHPPPWLQQLLHRLLQLLSRLSMVARGSRLLVAGCLLIALTILLAAVHSFGSFPLLSSFSSPSSSSPSSMQQQQQQQQQQSQQQQQQELVTPQPPLPVCPATAFLKELPSRRSADSLPAGCDAFYHRRAFSPRTDYPKHVAPVHSFLISFPRSGNTMSRKLIEDGTGVLTGSTYKELALPGVGVFGRRSVENVLLVKHHFVRMEPPCKVELSDLYSTEAGERHRRAKFAVERYIYILRNPMDSILSWWQFVHSNFSSHSGVYARPDAEQIVAALRNWLPVWAAHVRFFTSGFLTGLCKQCDAIVLRYEDFIVSGLQPKDTEAGRRVLCFLGFPQHRDCRPAGSELPNASWAYAEKKRQSLADPTVSLPRDVSYLSEVFALLDEEQIDWVDRTAGLEMRAFHYWPADHGTLARIAPAADNASSLSAPARC